MHTPGLTRQQLRLLMEVYAGGRSDRVWRDRASGMWTILDNASEGEGDEDVNPRTAAALMRRGLVRFVPHHSSQRDWVELTDEGDRVVGRYVAAQDGPK